MMMATGTQDIFAAEIPDLLQRHLEHLTQGSGLPLDIIRERGYRSILSKQQLADAGFASSQRRPPGLLLPVHSPDSSSNLYSYRPDLPRTTQDGKTLKYELPKGTTVRLDVPPRCRPLLADPAMPLWLTEGQKKADALAAQGLCAGALLGVWNFKGRNAFGGIVLLADFDYIAWNGRDVRLVFDSDVMTKRAVQDALARLTEHLRRKGAYVMAVYLPTSPDGGKIGVDDYLLTHTLSELEALIDSPRPQPQPAPSQVELLDDAPACIRRPLALINAHTYAATWLHARVTRREALDKQGNVVRLATPKITMEQRLFIVRDDGVTFSEEGADKPFADLGVDVQLATIPMPQKLWTVPGVKAYKAGERPDPGTTFRQVVSVVDRFIDFDRSLGSQQTMCELVACYILATWVLDAFTVIGYLWPNGEKGSGKTQLLTIIAELGYLGHTILAGGSYASLRDLADYGATLCFDDAENVMDMKRGDADKRALLLAGNRRGNVIPVKEPVNGREWQTRYVHTFCPRCFSAIRLPDPVLASRTIILPLIRTADRDKANADPLDYRLWPLPREHLVDNLWALALSQCAIMPSFDMRVTNNTTLLGRNLEPWRAILAVASWLTSGSVPGLFTRMEALALAYQKERSDLEPADLTVLTIQTLCHYAMSAMSAMSLGGAAPDKTISFTTAALTEMVRDRAMDQEIDIESESISTRRIGRVLGKMRLKEKPRSGGKGLRQWQLSYGELQRWLVSYGMPVPQELCNVLLSSQLPSPHGTHGIDGTHGTVDRQVAQTNEYSEYEDGEVF